MNNTQNLRIKSVGQDTWLMGDCLNKVTGHWNPSSLRLDSYLGDEGGDFQWGGHEFTEKASNITFNADEGAAHQPILRADLLDDAGEFHEADKNLSERISNVNGQFEFR
ncbi:hypothetical protein N7537_011220 [Penicillium hordei]|uniref:Cyanovirin-N domain-containing protein n=1 Tax=Penicillium hordei TaxID=40994 RepID=A0AAD6GTF4_9EURO|nr:uncharacterized protein N7537_011220 [Penicillium hordei]KAJ5588542.1 hypothetical protein N7537_011220 [Penicillium hordei]